jgi:hypothetical protein
MFEVIRHSKATSFQRCGHKHRSKKAAERCLKKHGKDKGWKLSNY